MRPIFILSLLLLSSCNPGIVTVAIPETNFKLSVPSDWIRLNSDDYAVTLREDQNASDIPEQYIESFRVISSNDDLDLYFFLKPQASETDNTFANFQVLTMKLDGESVVLDEILEAQFQQVSQLPGISNVEVGGCPEMSFTTYRCFKVENNITERSAIQYNYILTDSDKLVTMTLTTTTTGNLPELSAIIASVGR